MPTKRKTSQDRTSYRMKPGKPSPKMSQGGYGHRSSTTGRTAPQGAKKNTAKR